MKLIGVDLHQHLLGAALRSARGETADLWVPELNLGSVGALPEAWLPEAEVRLTLYTRLARINNESELDAFEEELVDRFGPLPEPAEQLIAHARLRLAARAACVARVDAGPAAIALTPRGDFVADPAAHGLSPKKDRLLLVEAIEDCQRNHRIQTLLEALAA